MDTIPFNLILLAVDITLLWGLALWGNKRLWFCAAIIDLVMIKGVSFLFRLHYGQNVVDGVCFHFGPFLIISGIILYFRRFRKTGVLSIIPGLLLLILGIDCVFYEPYAVVVERYTVESSKVEKPIRVVFVADTQTDKISDYELKVFRLMNSQDADIVIFGGDYIQFYGKTGKYEDVPGLHERFRDSLEAEGFKPPLGAYAIYGNNESGEKMFQGLFKDTGIQAISKTKTIDLGPIVLTILSLDESALSKYGKGARPKVFLETEEEKAKFHLMVGHVPAYVTGLTDADLMLAGHTHGGQIIIPFFGPIMTGVPERIPFPRKWAVGMHELPNGSRFLVTRGSGMERGWAPEVRLFCKPEISVIDIVPNNK